MTRTLRLPPLALACLAGAAWAFGAAPSSLVPLMFAGAYLFLEALRRSEIEDGGADVRRGATLGLAFGMGFHAIAFYWVYPLFTSTVPIPWPIAALGTVLTWLWQAAPFVAAGAAAAVLRSARLPWSLALAIGLPVGLTHVPMLFPWRPSELVVGLHAFAQIADLSGPPLLDVVLVLAACATLEGLADRRPLLLLLGLASAIGPFVYGAQRIDEVQAIREAAPIARVGAVQPNIRQRLKFQSQLADAQLEVLRRLTRELEARGVDFTAWPETSYPHPFPRNRLTDPSGRTGIRHRNKVRGPVVFGTISTSGACGNANSVVAMDSRGAITGLADKVMLFPFSETVPFWEHLTFLHRYLPCPGFAPGPGPSVLDVAGIEVGILNCYEDLMPEFTRQLALRRPDFLLNLTNDAWFMDTSEPHLHHMAARLRAIETRRDLVRVVNTGLTGHVDATGRRLTELPVWREGSVVFEVPRMPAGESPYLRHGDMASPVLDVLFALGWLVAAGFALRDRRALGAALSDADRAA